jgi:hypothetical protein
MCLQYFILLIVIFILVIIGIKLKNTNERYTNLPKTDLQRYGVKGTSIYNVTPFPPIKKETSTENKTFQEFINGSPVMLVNYNSKNSLGYQQNLSSVVNDFTLCKPNSTVDECPNLRWYVRPALNSNNQNIILLMKEEGWTTDSLLQYQKSIPLNTWQSGQIYKITVGKINNLDVVYLQNISAPTTDSKYNKYLTQSGNSIVWNQNKTNDSAWFITSPCTTTEEKNNNSYNLDNMYIICPKDVIDCCSEYCTTDGVCITKVPPPPPPPTTTTQQIDGTEYCKQQSSQLYKDDSLLKFCGKNGKSTCTKICDNLTGVCVYGDDCKCCQDPLVCNSDTGNCECLFNTQNDPNNCGTCGNNCDYNNQFDGLSCKDGKCVCPDGTTTDKVRANPKNCGSCGKVCNNDEICIHTPGTSNLNDRCQPCWTLFPNDPNKFDLRSCENKQTGEYECKNTRNDSENCGLCGNKCGPDQTCFNGNCVCAISAFKPCGIDEQGNSKCIDVSSDPNNCGNCGNKCSGDRSICQNGTCVCDPGKVDCAGECKDITNDNDNCGACGQKCESYQTCQNGVCECPNKTYLSCDINGQNCDNKQAFAKCDPNRAYACYSLEIDSENCGVCGNKCFGDKPVCSGGKCVCDPNSNTKPNTCGNDCVNLRNDNNNCGACGNKCPTNTNCINSECVCNNGVLCDSQCLTYERASVYTDHCGPRGQCNQACGPNQYCVSDAFGNGRCKCDPLIYPPATALYADESSANGFAIQGQCYDYQNDPNNCGAWGRSCPTNLPNCVQGTCTDQPLVCQDPTKRCGVMCVNTTIDPKNCGSCGTICDSNKVCKDGNCQCPDGTLFCQQLGKCIQPTGDISGYSICSDGTCIPTNNDNNNCGNCGVSCPVHSSCQNGVCVCDTPLVMNNGNCTCPINTFYQDGQCLPKNYVWAKSGLYYKGTRNTLYEEAGNPDGDWQEACLVKDQNNNVYSGTYYSYSDANRGRCLYQDKNNNSQVAYDDDIGTFPTFPVLYGTPNISNIIKTNDVSNPKQKIWSGNVDNTSTYLCRANGTDGSSYFGYVRDNLCNITDKAGVSSDVPNFNYVATISASYENKIPENCVDNLCSETSVPQGVIGIGKACSATTDCLSGSWCQSGNCVEQCMYNSTYRIAGFCDIANRFESCEHKDCANNYQCMKFTGDSYVNGIDADNRAVPGSQCV